MDTWMRFMSSDGGVVFGRVEGGYLHEYESLDQPVPTGAVLSTRALAPIAPCAPGKIVALWNNYHALAAKLDKPVPAHPLFLLKPAGSVIGAGEPIRRPLSYAGKIVYEGELGIVIGRRCRDASVEEAAEAIFGYTLVNDVTAADLLNENPDPTEEEIREGLEGNLCRCTGYHNIVRAVQTAAAAGKGAAQ